MPSPFPGRDPYIESPALWGDFHDVVTTLPGVPMTPERSQVPAWRYLDLLHLRQRVEDAGLTLSVIEGYQLSDRITLGQLGRDEDLDRLCEIIANIGRAGMKSDGRIQLLRDHRLYLGFGQQASIF